MPVLPQPIDLTKSKRFNKDRVLTVDTFGALIKLPEDKRAEVISSALTAKQRAEFEEFYKNPDRIKLPNVAIPNYGSSLLTASYGQTKQPIVTKSPTKRRRKTAYIARYDAVSQILEINGQPIILSGAKFQAAICYVVTKYPLLFKRMFTYQEMLKHGTIGEQLRQRDIISPSQLRTAKEDLNKKVRAITLNDDFLIGRGGIQRNPRFRRITS